MPITYCAALDGRDSDLALLGACFTEPTCRVVCRNRGDGVVWTLRSSDLVLNPKPERRLAITNTGHDEVEFDGNWDAVETWVAERLPALNGAARLLEPRYEPVEVVALRSEAADGTALAVRATSRGLWVPGGYRPPENPEVRDLVRRWAALALRDEAVATVLAVLAMPPTWTALGLVLNAISDDVGGQEGLEQWIAKPWLRRLTGSIHFARKLEEGPRHLGKVDGKWNADAALDLRQARRGIDELVNGWIGSKIGRVAHRTYR